jgi:hypothetical protein
MRQGRAEDTAGILDLWAEDVSAGRRVYRKLGYKLAFETEVWEARLQ